MTLIKIMRYSTVLLFFLFNVSAAQVIRTSVNYSGVSMSFNSAYNALNSNKNTGNSGVNMGGLNLGNISFNTSKKNLHFYEPRNESMGIIYLIPFTVGTDVAYLMSMLTIKEFTLKLFGRIAAAQRVASFIKRFKYKDISLYAPLNLTIEFRTNPPYPVVYRRNVLMAHNAAMQFKEISGKKIFSIKK